MIKNTKLTKIGNSIGAVFPKEMLKMSGITNNIIISIDHGGILIKAAPEDDDEQITDDTALVLSSPEGISVEGNKITFAGNIELELTSAQIKELNKAASASVYKKS